MADCTLPQIRGTLRPAPLKDQAGIPALSHRRDPLFVRGMWLLVLSWILLEFSLSYRAVIAISVPAS